MTLTLEKSPKTEALNTWTGIIIYSTIRWRKRVTSAVVSH